MKRFGRMFMGVALALGLLGAVPAAAFAATPSCGDTLVASTTLTADLDCSAYAGDALTLSANGITLDLNGHTITGPTGDDTYSGVHVDGKNSTVTNGTIENFDTGVYLASAINTTVSWLNINGEAADTNDYGINVQYGVGNKINHNTIDGEYYGMNLYGSALNVVSMNDITADSIGAYTEYETSDRFSHNTATAPDGFYDDYSGDQQYLQNTANGGDYGIYVDCDGYGVVTLIGNKANNNAHDGLYLYECGPDNGVGGARSVVQGNTANGNGYGIYAECDGYGVVSVIGNHANNNASDGVYTYECYLSANLSLKSLVKGNTANGNNIGFYDYYSTSTTWSMNTANHNADEGLYLDYPGGATITFNTANHNSSVGIELVDAYSAGYGGPKTVSWNTASWNDSGITSDYGARGKGNVAHHNPSGNCSNVVCN